MNLYCKHIKIFNNKELSYLYHYDHEIMYVSNKVRACLEVYVDEQKYAIPFRSNMKHRRGKVFISGVSKYGADFTKAIPIINESLLEDGNFLLKEKEKEYYSKDENYMMFTLMFKEHLKNIYFDHKHHATNHTILVYAQKYKIILNINCFKIFDYKKEPIFNFLNIINYKSLYSVIDKAYANKDKIIQNNKYCNDIVHEFEKANNNIMLLIVKREK